MRKKAVILGAAGQDGFYLNRLLDEHGLDVFATARAKPNYQQCDAGDFEQVRDLIHGLQPDYLFHLAAVSSADHSALAANQKAIVDGTLNVLEAARQHAPECRIFIAGSALQFTNSGAPLHEGSPLSWSSAYAAQRNASVFMARYFRERFSMPVFIGYFFHHDSPRRSEHHIAQKIATAARLAAENPNVSLKLEDWNFTKEWTFAGDAASAIWVIVNQNKHYEFVIGSGQPHSIRDWANECFAHFGLDYQQHVTSRIEAESDSISCNPALLLSFGWRPHVSFHDLAKMMVTPNATSVVDRLA